MSRGELSEALWSYERIDLGDLSVRERRPDERVKLVTVRERHDDRDHNVSDVHTHKTRQARRT